VHFLGVDGASGRCSSTVLQEEEQLLLVTSSGTSLPSPAFDLASIGSNRQSCELLVNVQANQRIRGINEMALHFILLTHVAFRLGTQNRFEICN
jgi:hypothetical protein